MNEVNLFQCEAQGIPVLGLAWYVSGPELEAKSGVDLCRGATWAFTADRLVGLKTTYNERIFALWYFHTHLLACY